jgi:hypothetical protein
MKLKKRDKVVGVEEMRKSMMMVMEVESMM